MKSGYRDRSMMSKQEMPRMVAASSRRSVTSLRRRTLTLDPRLLDVHDDDDDRDDDANHHHNIHSLIYLLSLSLSLSFSSTWQALKICTKVRHTRAPCIPRNTFVAEMQNTDRQFISKLFKR